MKIERHLSLRDDELLKKFRYICEYDDRSSNGKLLSMLRKSIVQFEKEHGEIVLEDK